MPSLIVDAKNARKNSVASQNTAFATEFAIKIPAGTTAGTYDLTGVTIGPGTAIAGIGLCPVLDSTGVPTAIATTTFALNAIRNAGDTVNAASVALRAAAVTGTESFTTTAIVCNSAAAFYPQTLQLVIAAATVAAANTLYVTLLCCPIGKEIGRQTSVGN
jgi:hypothetical protein